MRRPMSSTGRRTSSVLAGLSMTGISSGSSASSGGKSSIRFATMCMMPGFTLQFAADADKARAENQRPEALEFFRPDNDVGDDAAFGQVVAQEGNQVCFQRHCQRSVIMDDMFAQRHGRRRAPGRGQAGVVATVFFIYVLNHLLAALMLEIDIDIRRLAPFRRDGALEKKIGHRRVDRGDADAVADGGIGRRSSGPGIKCPDRAQMA